MSRADVVVIGAGFAGLTAAARLAEAGATVRLVAKGHTTTHWGSGGIDVASAPGPATAADGVARLAAGDHPYALLASHVEPAITWLLARLADAGLPYVGTLATPIRRVPTAIGGTRPVSIVPLAQSAALRPWDRDETLVVVGIDGFKDFWPASIATSLRRDAVWLGADRPARVVAVSVDLPGVAGRHNINALELARRFDDPALRDASIDRLAQAVERAAGGRNGRVALPAVIGLKLHAEAWAALVRRLPLEPFEVPLVPPSIPGVRLWQALRGVIRAHGGYVEIGEMIDGIEHTDGHVDAVRIEAAARTRRIETGALVLATGGILGGGIVASIDGTLDETLLHLPVDAPAHESWLVRDGLDPMGHPIEAAGIRTDALLRPLDPSTGRPSFGNVRVVGALLAGQRPMRERCGDGVAITSGWHAANTLARPTAGASPDPVPTTSRAER